MKNTQLTPMRGLTTLLVLCAAIVTFSMPTTTHAQAWRFEPVVKVGLELEDNPKLEFRTDEEINLQGYLLDASVNMSYSSPATTFFLQPRVSLRNYPDDPDFDSDDFFLRSQYRRATQSSVFGFRANFDHQSVRTAERSDSDLDIDDPDELTDDDSARVLLFGERDKWRFAPYWEYQFSQKSSFHVDVDFFNVEYSDDFVGTLRDYTDGRLNLGYSRALSTVTRGRITATARKYEAEGATDEVTGTGVMLGFDHSLSQQTTLTAMVGVEETETGGVSTDAEVVGYVRLMRNLETIRLFAQYRRSIFASGVGRLSVRDSISLNFRRRLNDKISAGLGVRAYESSSGSEVPTVDDRSYIQLQSSFQWYLSTSMVIEASYRYTVLDRSDTIGERSNSNRVNLWFIYQPNTIPRI